MASIARGLEDAGWNIGQINAPSLASTSLIRALPRYADRVSSPSAGEMTGSVLSSPAPNGNRPEDVMRCGLTPKAQWKWKMLCRQRRTKQRQGKLQRLRMFDAQLNIEFE